MRFSFRQTYPAGSTSSPGAGPSRLAAGPSPAQPGIPSASSSSSEAVAAEAAAQAHVSRIPPTPNPSPATMASSSLGARRGQIPGVRPDKQYIGPDPGSLQPQRTKAEAEKFYEALSKEKITPSRFSKGLAISSWVLGGVAVVYMTLYADFGNREHVFSPLRRHFSRLTNDYFTLSASERKMLDLDRPFRTDAEIALDEKTPPGRAV